MTRASIATIIVLLAGAFPGADAQTPPGLTTAPVDTASRELRAPFTRPIVISSLGSYFSVVGRVVGRATVFEDSIVVELDTLFATRVHHGGPVQVTRLDSVRIGVGKGTERSWSPTDNSRSQPVEHVMAVGSTLHQPSPARFVIPHARSEDDGNAWLVVTFHLTVGRQGEPDYHSDATTYAHSAKGVLVAPPTSSSPAVVPGG